MACLDPESAARELVIKPDWKRDQSTADAGAKKKLCPWLLTAILCSSAWWHTSSQALAGQPPLPSTRTDRSAAATVAATGQETAGDLAAKIIAAYGGLDKLKEIKAQPFRSRGTLSATSGMSGAANSFECDILGQGDKLRIETAVMGQPIVLAFDGVQSWTQFGDWVSASTETSAKRIAEELKHGLNLLLDLSSPKYKLELTGKRAVRGKICYVLRIVGEDGKPTTFFVDEKTHMVLRTEYIGVDQEQGITTLQAVEYDDYRPTNGSFTAFKTTEYSGSKRTSETILQSLELGASFDEKVFTMPPESEIARLKEGPVTIPFEFKANEIIIKARLAGRADCNFIIDTGASQTVLDKAAATTLGAYSLSNFSITAGSKAIPLSYTTLPSIGLGDLTLNNIPALVTDLSSFAQAIGERPTGLIGANILRRFLVTIDFAEHKLVLSDPRSVTAPAEATAVKTAPIFGATALVVSGKLDDRLNINFLVDTGAAFNNLPQSAARPLLSGQILPVGQIFGIDGQKLAIGAVKLKSLSLASLGILRPVFAVSPDGASSSGSSGLFTAGSIGILGNPIWSRFRMTIDYRNERLFLEPRPDRLLTDRCSEELDRIFRDYLRNRNIDLAIKADEKVSEDARQKGDKAGEALALASLGMRCLDKFERSGDSSYQTAAAGRLAKAADLARQSHNQAVEGKVLAQWADFYLHFSSNPTSLFAAQSLMTRAASRAPTESSVYATLGSLTLKVGKPSLAAKLLDQSIMLDPANWSALWSEYRLYESQHNLKMQMLVLTQLKRYYPDVPEVIAAERLLSSSKRSGQKNKALIQRPAGKTASGERSAPRQPPGETGRSPSL